MDGVSVTPASTTMMMMMMMMMQEDNPHSPRRPTYLETSTMDLEAKIAAMTRTCSNESSTPSRSPTESNKKRSRTRTVAPAIAAALILSSSLPYVDALAFVPGTATKARIRRSWQEYSSCNESHPLRRRLPLQHCRQTPHTVFAASRNGDKEPTINRFNDDDDDDDDDLSDEEFLRRELARLESLEGLIEDIEEYCDMEGMCEDDDDESFDWEDEFGEVQLDDLDKLDELFSLLEDSDDHNDDDDDDFEELMSFAPQSGLKGTQGNDSPKIFQSASKELEKALLQGVVPVDAEVGRDTIPGDWGFDPWNLADKDYIRQFQYRFLTMLPGGNPSGDPPPGPRPKALVLRDYREAEIRHGRLAMLAVVFWPLQEKLDQLLLDEDQFGPIIYGPVTLPYFPLLMTLIMMLLGYLDIYAKAIQEQDDIGDAFLPGDCFWDPLKILDGAPPSMKRNMQEREVTNGRMAMSAFAAFVFEEAVSHRALVTIPSNELLFEPAYQVPFIQEWLDQQFS